MKILGIDFGLSKVGVAVSEGELAEPLVVIKYKSSSELIQKLKRIIDEEKIEKVVIGISEGEMAQKAKEFGERIKEFVSVNYQDETLTTQDAINLSIQGGVGKEKRRKLEDAYAASLMLQDYIDNDSLAKE